MSDYILTDTGELYHFGVKGMKWGVRRYQNKDGSSIKPKTKQYRSTSLKSAIAKRKNQKVDEGFKNWKENAKKRDSAIELGKKATAAKRAYENDKSNDALKSAYKEANKAYKKALRENTTYRKGVVKQEVGRDAARKYLSEAKKLKKQMDADPTNKTLQKKYNELMSKYDIERANARRATEVSAARMRKVASIKRGMTMTVKMAAGTAAVAAGAYAVNRYLSNHDVTLNGNSLRINSSQIRNAANIGKRILGARNYFY